MYGAPDSDLNVIQHFLDGCHKRHLTSQPVSIFNVLDQQDKSTFNRAIHNHMLSAIIPKEKEVGYYLRKRKCHLSSDKNKEIQENFCKETYF